MKTLLRNKTKRTEVLKKEETVNTVVWLLRRGLRERNPCLTIRYPFPESMFSLPPLSNSDSQTRVHLRLIDCLEINTQRKDDIYEIQLFSPN